MITSPAQHLRLRYTRPARRWLEALPLGNGRIGAMVFGGVDDERIQLDEATFWSGEPSESNVRGGPADVALIRSRLFAGAYTEAEALCRKITGTKGNYGTHLPLGDLRITRQGDHGDIADYERWLDLRDATAGTAFRIGAVAYSRTCFVSHVHQVVVTHLTVGAPGALRIALSFEGRVPHWRAWLDSEGDLLLEARATEALHSDGRTGVTLHGRLRVLGEGVRAVAPAAIEVTGGAEAVVLMALRTTFACADPAAACHAAIETAARESYAALLAAHCQEHAALMGRLELSFGEDLHAALPTDERLARVRAGAADAGLDALMVQYGRYLTIASSRPESPLPAHLQGIWNDNRACRMAWTCDMHLDINTQMNYWLAGVGNLGPCERPLFAWMASTLRPSGERTARQLYGAGGWTAHTVANAWGYSAPGWHESWGIWAMGGAWLATHLWEHYCFHGDTAFLAEVAYPLLRSSAAFTLDYLTEEPGSGFLVTGPALSPENLFLADGAAVANSMGPTADTVLVRELFNACIAAARILRCDQAFVEQLQQALGRLPPFLVGRHGQLQEWRADHEPADPHHRHLSHLLALYPFAQITREATPELAAAARRSIELRLEPEGSYEYTNWGQALLMASWARLGDGDAAYNAMRRALSDLTAPNLFICHPSEPGAEDGIYELDGNTGMGAGALELLLQSHAGVIRLLPALPAAWPTGSLHGACARGGFVVDITWRDGRVTAYRIHSRFGNPCTVQLGDELRRHTLAAGETQSFRVADDCRTRGRVDQR